MEALSTNEIRQTKENGKEIPPREVEIKFHNTEMGKEIPPSEEGKESDPDARRDKEEPPIQQGKETSPDAKREKYKPPGDDVCTICFGNYKIPCKTNCGHWYCANCFISFWDYGNKLVRCKCPICSQSISKLTPSASLNRHTEDKEVVEALKKVQGYNRTFAGGVHGLIFGIIPCLWRRFYEGLYDPDNLIVNYIIAQAIALLVTLTYYCLDFDFLPGGYDQISCISYCSTVGLVIVFGAIGLYRKMNANRRLVRRRRRPRRNPVSVSVPKNPPVLGSPIEDKGPLVSGP